MSRKAEVVEETLRTRKQELVRREIHRAAWELFTRRGYETTTVDEIASAAGVSRRTVFRYYASKEDVVVGTFDALAAEFLEAVERRPRREPPLVSIQHAVVHVLAQRITDLESSRAILRLMRESPGLRRARLDRIARLEGRLAQQFAERHGIDPTRDSLPAVVGYVARALVDAAFNVWYEQGGPAVEPMVDRLFGNLARLAASWRPSGSGARRGAGARISRGARLTAVPATRLARRVKSTRAGRSNATARRH